jgi:antirestriction protein ArdC
MNADARNSIDNLLSTLKLELAAPGASLLPLLTTMSRFSRYSLANQMLIYAQRPAATHLLGYRGWLKAGYQVRKGEHGIAIYAPMRFKARDDDGTAATDDTAGRHRLGFRVAYVFDLAQVDPLPGTDSTVFATHFADTRAAELAIARLHAFLFGHNVELEYKDLAPGLMGYTDGRRITCGTGQATPVEFATLAHETTHLLLHFPGDRSTRPDLVTRETEAEAVARVVCAQLGLAGTEASVAYIRSYRGTPDTLDASLERIRTTALRLSTELAAAGWDEHCPPSADTL